MTTTPPLGTGSATTRSTARPTTSGDGSAAFQGKAVFLMSSTVTIDLLGMVVANVALTEGPVTPTVLAGRVAVNGPVVLTWLEVPASPRSCTGEG